jgi:Putative threonine/serine exporter
VIFGVHHFAGALLAAGSAGLGAFLRRGVARLSENVFLQPFCAALLAGVVGALAVRYQLSSSWALVALCPCMILIPGPHILNGGLDLSRSRVDLGASRILRPPSGRRHRDGTPVRLGAFWRKLTARARRTGRAAMAGVISCSENVSS